MAHFDMLIQPEDGSGVFPVSLWAVQENGAAEQLYAAPQASWLDYSQRLEQSKLMDERTLGHADACIFRGEPVVQKIHCSPDELAQMGFGDVQVALPKHLRLNALLSRREQAPTNDWVNDSDSQREPTSGGTESAVAAKTLHTFRNRIALLGVGIDVLSMDAVIERIDDLIDRGGCHQVATANVDFLTKAFDDPQPLDILNSCEMVLPDGMPLVWASRILGVPLKERVTGADLVPQLLELSARKKRRIFLLGATEENSRAAAQRVQQEYPDAILCGRYSPPFTSSDHTDDEQTLQLIAEAKPDILLVAFGNPKQEKWIAKHRPRLNVPVCIGVGASIDFFSGRQSRAPLWMQQGGLEWIYRMLSEPRRLALRYLNDALFLLRYLSVQLLTNSLQPRVLQKPQIKLSWHGSVLAVGIVGGFCGSLAEQLFQDLEQCNYDGPLILDLTFTEFIAPDAAGLLICLAQRCGRTGNELWIAGSKPALRAVLQATFPAGKPFRTAATLKEALRFIWSPSLYNTVLNDRRSETRGSEANVPYWKAGRGEMLEPLPLKATFPRQPR
jgi:N-acetylglucosaminyldiphosphoundecaprenol N-acetyl-beta-D-mannosaminyltransferase